MFKTIFIGSLMSVMTLSLPFLSPRTAEAHYGQVKHPKYHQRHRAPYCKVHHRYHYHKIPRRYLKPRRIAYRYPPPVQHCYWHYGRLHCFWAPY